MRTARLVALCAPLLAACWKVPIDDVAAGFTQADASWFDEEDTLFVFWDVTAEQGLGDPTIIEITYQTDAERVGWTDVAAFETVHTHVPVDCGTTRRCGSISIEVPLEPRNVDIRLRYHRDGDLALAADTVFNVVGEGPAHSSRSMVVYGVFDERNERIQWRGRHQFPTVRNMRASELGLRREFSIAEQSYGTAPEEGLGGAYAYGVPCDGFLDAAIDDVSTDRRAVFNEQLLPNDAADAAHVCARATVSDANGTFTTTARARKNPEVRSAFPVLRSPVEEATSLPFFLAPCESTIDAVHEAMQRQRLLMDEDDVPTTCIDDWRSDGFVDRLVVLFRDALEEERPSGRDMVLVVGVNQDDDEVSDKVEQALARVVPEERHRSTPRLTGAFVFDSSSRGLSEPGLAQSTLWCPSTIPLDEIPNESARSCPTLPDIPDIALGPLSFDILPILPSRDQYLDFVDDFNVRTAGEVTDLTYLAPELPTTTEHVDFGEFGVVTFPNGEQISAAPDDVFSYCAPDAFQPFVVSSDLMSDPEIAEAIRLACAQDPTLPQELCAVAESGVLPVSFLGEWHEIFGETRYDLGLFWEFPFLLRMQYQTPVAGSVTAFGLTVPFGLGSPAESYYGAEVWASEELVLDPSLTQCRRYCDHPTFDSAGVYQVRDLFSETYTRACYLPAYPSPQDAGFPLDP